MTEGDSVPSEAKWPNVEVPLANGTLSEQEAGALLRTPTKDRAPAQMTINVDVTFKIRVLELMVR